MNKIIKSLRRITSKGEFIPEIDGLRFLAIAPVVMMHADTNYNRIFNSDLQIQSNLFNQVINDGWKGVWIFFGISGFILSYFFAKHFYINKLSFKELQLKPYFIRRLTRLEPPFLISMSILFIFTSIVVVHSFSFQLPNFLASIIYSHNLIFGKWSPINPVTWSLEVEVQFYIIAPFLSGFLFMLKENTRNFILVSLIILLPFLILNKNSPFVNIPNLAMTLPVFIQHFLVGILFTSLYTGKYWLKIKKKNPLWDIISIVAIIIIFFNNHITLYAFDLCLFLLMIGAFKGVLINMFFSNPLITTFGGMCYSIYLIHYGVIYGVQRIFTEVRFDTALINYIFHITISTIMVVIISIIFFIYFERPFMDKHWPEKLKNHFPWMLSSNYKFIPRYFRSKVK